MFPKQPLVLESSAREYQCDFCSRTKRTLKDVRRLTLSRSTWGNSVSLGDLCAECRVELGVILIQSVPQPQRDEAIPSVSQPDPNLELPRDREV